MSLSLHTCYRKNILTYCYFDLNCLKNLLLFSFVLRCGFKIIPFSPMQFFDLNRQFNFNDLLTPNMTLAELGGQDWYLAKVRVEHDCIDESPNLLGQMVLQSDQSIQIELDWVIQDTGHQLQVLFKGIESKDFGASRLLVTGAQVVDDAQQVISAEALSLWLDGTLLPMLPNLRRDIKARLNLWDYVEYDV